MIKPGKRQLYSLDVEQAIMMILHRRKATATSPYVGILSNQIKQGTLLIAGAEVNSYIEGLLSH